MSDDRCEITDLIKDQCAHCRPAVEQSADPAIVAIFAARYYGRCDWRDNPIQPGDRIGKDEHGSNVCQECLP